VVSRLDVIELEHDHVSFTAVLAGAALKVLEDSELERPLARVLRCLRLSSVKVAALPEIRTETFAAPVLASLAGAIEGVLRKFELAATARRHRSIVPSQSDGPRPLSPPDRSTVEGSDGDARRASAEA
jgi:hypothetical protein